MELKLGDFVRFVDENLEGYVTRIIDKDTVGVTDSNDFEIPVMASKVTLIHGEIPDNDTVINNRPAVKTIAPSEFVKTGIYLGLVSDQHSTAVAHFHLVNNTSFELLTSFSTEKGNHFKGEFAGSTLAHTAKKIYSANMGDIQLWPKFRLDIIFHTPSDQETPRPLIYEQSIKGKDLSVAKEDIFLLKTKGWLIRLDTPETPLDLNKLRDSFK